MPLRPCEKTASGKLTCGLFFVFCAATRFVKEATILLKKLLSPLFLSFVIFFCPRADEAVNSTSYHQENEEHIFESETQKIHFNRDGEITFFELKRTGKYNNAFIPTDPETEESFPGFSARKGIRIGSPEKQDFFTGSDTTFSYDEKNSTATFTTTIPPEHETMGGVRINKIWTITDKYQLRFNLEIHNPTAKNVSLPPENFGLVYGFIAEFDYWTSCVYGSDREKIEKFTPEADLKPIEANWNFLAYRSQFFVLALHQNHSAKLQAAQKPPAYDQEQKKNLITFFLPLGQNELKTQETIKREYTLYLGEKREETMVPGQFSHLFDKYGVWFGAIERPLFALLTFFYNLTGSYGLAILLLTLVVKIVLLPLNIKQVRSMAKMQQIQPEMRRIQEEFKDDRQRQSQEIMRLYQVHNVNPLAGCLPLLLQMPIFFALFYTVGGSVEMYGENFLWLNDLARRDPTEILPILFVVSFLWSQRKMMSDPNQKMMMLMMPVLFFFMMRQLPAGVMLYIVGQSIFSAVEQVVVPRPAPSAANTGNNTANRKHTDKAPQTEKENPRPEGTSNNKKNRHRKKR